MFNIADTLRSIWHVLATNDRHASYNSPYKTGQHVPIPQSRHAPLTAIATSAIDSRVDLASDIPISASESKSQTNAIMAASAPYSSNPRFPQRPSSVDSIRKSSDKSPVVEMQDFAEGLPPAPPVSHSWQRIERWAEDQYVELYDNLGEGCSLNDVNELEHELDCTLPQDVRDSLQIHDGQERGGLPTGIIFGSMLLDCEEIVQEWSYWRATHEQHLANRIAPTFTPFTPASTFASSSSSSGPSIPVSAQTARKSGAWKDDFMSRQDCQPPNSVQKVYIHRSWIPLSKDWGGNCLAVDLAPGPSGKWGQVIIFGRDYDCKYVVARSWAAFMANLADDLSSGDKVHIDQDTNELKLVLFKNAQPSYLEILRWRCDEKYGRRPPSNKRSSTSSLRVNSSVPIGPSFGGSSSSPYASPVDRSRSPQRPNGKAPMIFSPARPLISSPLARFAEESSMIQHVVAGRSDSEMNKMIASRNSGKFVAPPRQSQERPLSTPPHVTTKKETQPTSQLGYAILNSSLKSTKKDEIEVSSITSIEPLAEEMETVTIQSNNTITKPR